MAGLLSKKKKKVSMKVGTNFIKLLGDRTFDRFIGHHKIIRFDGGFPVYSIMLPPSLSGPFATLQLTMFSHTMQNRPLPAFVSVALTDKCNAKCEHCSFYTSCDEPGRPNLTVEEWKAALKIVQNMGTSVLNFVGGEPLMHPQWREIIGSVDKAKSHVFMFTNGLLLAESAADLKAVGVGGVYTSIDAHTAEEHDRKRGVKGLFNKAMEGIEAAIKADLTVGMSCCIDEDDFNGGELDRIIELAKQRGVHEVIVFDATPVGRFSGRDDLRGKKPWQTTMIEYVKKYNDDESYPGIFVYAHFSSYLSLGCPGGTAYMYITPYGDICPCDFCHTKFGNIKEESIHILWDKMSQKIGGRGSSWYGCRVKVEQPEGFNK